MNKKDENAASTDVSGFLFHLDKSTALQEARVFNESPIRPSRCCATLTKVLYLLYQGEQFQVNEATNLFFSVTKLFQSKDMVYLIIKELANIAEDVIMATSSLTKDMNDKVAAEIGYRANAASMVQAIERFIKQAIVDKDAAVGSSALVSAIHLFNQGNKEVVKRWINEVQESLTRQQGLVQYHGFGLIYQIRQHDKMAVMKMLQTLSKGNSLRNPLAHCMLIRFTFKLMDDDGGLEGPSRGMFEIIENCLRSRYEMVNLEAARAICNLRGVTGKELFPVVSVMQLFLNSPKSTIRFAAIRTLSKLAASHPDSVATCNLDMENLITDGNRSIATFAITTLLKTGNEASVDRLMKQISGFMAEISDEFKVIVVDAIRALCLKFPAKQAMMLTFLSNSLRDEGGYEFKRGIVEAIFDIIAAIPESKEAALAHLCEFIEDCEFTRLSTRVLRLLGEEGPKMPSPIKYVRYIYNRTILENAPIRAAAVSALVKFATSADLEMRKNIRVLLHRCLDDPDDEVRDRAVMYVRILDDEEHGADISRKYITDDSIFSMAVLESQLAAYVGDIKAQSSPFDMSLVPVLSRAQEQAANTRGRVMNAQFAQSNGLVSISPTRENAPSSLQDTVKSTDLTVLPELATYGPLFHSSIPVELTETDVAEYVVSCVKHMFNDVVVFQFICKNTLDDVMLENVTVEMEAVDECDLSFVSSIAIKKLSYDAPESAYVVFKKNGGKDSFPIATFTAILKFISKDCDAQTGVVDDEGYDDSYQMENLELSVGDYIMPTYLSSFVSVWDSVSNEIVETFQLETINTVQDAIKEVKSTLGMSASENTDQLPKDKNTITSHTLLLSGMFVGGVKCLCRVRMACAGGGVTIELSVRSDRQDVSELVSELIA